MPYVRASSDEVDDVGLGSSRREVAVDFFAAWVTDNPFEGGGVDVGGVARSGRFRPLLGAVCGLWGEATGGHDVVSVVFHF